MELVRRTKIIATLGPASASRELIAEMVRSGVDVFRLNFSHGDWDEHRERMEDIRAIEAEVGWPLGVLQDLQGPKIRTGTFAASGGVELREGTTFRLTTDLSPGDETRVGTTLPELVAELEPGQRLLLNDGLVELLVTAREPGALVTQVIYGGYLSDHKGINVPEADLSVPALSAKDLHDLEYGVSLGVDWVALSFVRRPSDLKEARAALDRLGSRAKLMAKIEKPGAVTRFEEILAEADGVMIARGDLGVEMPPEDVPVVQRHIISRSIEAGKPVVVATQMLESMIHNPRPTRAEASDVANAIYEGADAVMLSGETAVGRYPLEAVRMMDRVAKEVEASPNYAERLYSFPLQEGPSIPHAVCHSACRIAQILPAEVIASFTWTGSTAWRVARYRPRAMVVALTPFEKVARQLTVGWGIVPLTAPDPTSTDRMTAQAIERLRAAGIAEPGQTMVLTAGVPFGQSGTTNMVRVERLGEQQPGG
ncbi:MAG: pyruvate kinase [Armatimonadetes bacterium]|nr:pyruvate kinase [Armatimonadota bacterium]